MQYSRIFSGELCIIQAFSVANYVLFKQLHLESCKAYVTMDHCENYIGATTHRILSNYSNFRLL